MKLLKILAAAGAALLFLSSCEKDERIIVDASLQCYFSNTMTITVEKVSYAFSSSHLDDDDIFDIFEDLSKEVTSSFDEAFLTIKIYNEITEEYIRSETHHFVWDPRVERYVLLTEE